MARRHIAHDIKISPSTTFLPPLAAGRPEHGAAPAKRWNRVGATLFDGFLIGVPVGIVAVATGLAETSNETTAQLAILAVSLAYAVLMLTITVGTRVVRAGEDLPASG